MIRSDPDRAAMLPGRGVPVERIGRCLVQGRVQAPGALHPAYRAQAVLSEDQRAALAADLEESARR